MTAMWDRARRLAVPVLAVAAVAMSGCTSYVTTQVTAFSAWSGSDATRTYAFSRSSAQQNSIEEATYEQLVANELDLYAFRPRPAGEANYLVSLSYDTRGDTMTVSQPVYYGSPWAGPYWRPFDPWGPFGAFPAGYVSQTYPVYTHTLGIRMTERSTGKEVYNVTARDTDDDSSLVRAMPYLVRGALADFPLGNGVVRTVRIPVDKKGRAASNEVPVVPAAATTGASGAATAPR
ncbi:DUF4136 domain-containing protein [Trinickia caryophylli]|uniref:DUF4136 domain-containing protein n=1 Tax=Trinickia caryophylli TaxID=28094 RepID=A0A1X7CLH9_TRICW|nr:DUF4136 domain-containing protein [Trinickia caryophylli]TRX20424.1 DUF4136 domain-containing protein [Trinickia caryophylli]GLU30319.1 lipoprotein [Trinickia caryophylli]SME98836.1 protein of unknown function [Trinickia caryophylli]